MPNIGDDPRSEWHPKVNGFQLGFQRYPYWSPKAIWFLNSFCLVPDGRPCSIGFPSDYRLLSDGHLVTFAGLIRNSGEGSMPTIAFVSPKGGAGKTTSAFLLSAELAKLCDVTIIDADPNHPVQTWAGGGNTPPRLTIMSDADEDTIIERIEDAAEKTPFVVADLEGTASKIVIYAISQADFVIIPTQGSQLDANEASRAIRVVLQSQKMTGKTIPYSVLLTRTNSSIRTRACAYSKRIDRCWYPGPRNRAE
jgi:hypothetical protein